QRGLDAFAALAPEERRLDPATAKALAAGSRWRNKYPEDGLVLVVTTRDLPRDGDAASCSSDWNRDFAWFRKDEARAFLPADPVAGAQQIVPGDLVSR